MTIDIKDAILAGGLIVSLTVAFVVVREQTAATQARLADIVAVEARLADQVQAVMVAVARLQVTLETLKVVPK